MCVRGVKGGWRKKKETNKINNARWIMSADNSIRRAYSNAHAAAKWYSLIWYPRCYYGRAHLLCISHTINIILFPNGSTSTAILILSDLLSGVVWRVASVHYIIIIIIKYVAFYFYIYSIYFYYLLRRCIDFSHKYFIRFIGITCRVVEGHVESI